MHYLRTNNLEIPSGLNRQSLQFEAEFYGIQKIVEHLKHLESEKQRKEAEKNSKYNSVLCEATTVKPLIKATVQICDTLDL